MKRGAFITIEGGEGSGKSTQISLLKATLEREAIPHIITREPGGEQGAEAIRALLVSGDAQRWDSLAETLLFAAARVQHVARLIEPALAAGKMVVCDRFFDSTRVYQGLGKGIAAEYLNALHSMTLGNLAPDITFILDIAPETGLKRTASRCDAENRFESMNIEFHRKVRSGFAEIAASEPERCFIIDSNQDIFAIHEQIWNKLSQKLHLAKS